MLTLSNLICGSLALHAVIERGDFKAAFLLIILAACFDFTDGFAARLLKQTSEIGVQLDSLADMVSFGVAPAMVMSRLFVESDKAIDCAAWAQYGQYIPYIIAAFSALRLAKFNIDTEQKEQFIGLPTPACAIVCVSLGLIHLHGGVTFNAEWVAIISVALAALLVSPITMFALKFKSFRWSDNKVRFSFLITALLLLIIKPLIAMPAIVALYILISIILHIATKQNR